jgi:cytochrome c oxidase cbb3-type subunit III
MGNGISLFIIVVTIVNILACLWLIWWTSRSRPEEAAQGNTTGHVWDGDLTEYNNPMPRWWLGLFLLTIVFGFIYLAIYPGLGSYAGASGWSQIAQYEEEVQRAEARTNALYAPLAGLSIAELAHNPTAMSAARNLFANNCSTCHGSDARGARGFPNLTDGDWLWGGAPETIEQTIQNGRTGVMPALGSSLGNEGTEQVIAYVLSLSGRTAPADWVAQGKERFAICAACHGMDAKGNPLLGAPNLTDNIWVYGSTPADIRETITLGRNNAMPAHGPLLGEAKVRLLAAYVYGLSRDDEDEPEARANAGDEDREHERD